MVISSGIGTVTSVQTGLDQRFAQYVVDVTDGVLIRQPILKTLPPVLSIVVNRSQIGSSTKITRDIAIPTKFNINSLKHPGTNWKLSPEYELRYVAVHSGPNTNGGHYYGYKYHNDRWIKLNDGSVSNSTENVPVITSGGVSTAHSLYYVNVGKKAELLKEEPVVAKIMAQIDGELVRQSAFEVKHFIILRTSSSSSSRLQFQWFRFQSSGSGPVSGSGSSSSVQLQFSGSAPIPVPAQQPLKVPQITPQIHQPQLPLLKSFLGLASEMMPSM